jgi:hypothetical protein
MKWICFEVLLAFRIWFSALCDLCFAIASSIILALNFMQHDLHPRLQFQCLVGFATLKSKNAKHESIAHLFLKIRPANRIFTPPDSAFTLHLRPSENVRKNGSVPNNVVSRTSLHRSPICRTQRGCLKCYYCICGCNSWQSLQQIYIATRCLICTSELQIRCSKYVSYFHKCVLFYYKTKSFHDVI